MSFDAKYDVITMHSFDNLWGIRIWFRDLAPLFARMLTPNGSIVIEMGNAWEQNRSVQSLLTINSLLEFVNNPDAGLILLYPFLLKY